MGTKIHSIHYYLPEKVITNDQLSMLFPEWSSNSIYEKVGIQERRIVRDNETGLDLAEKACQKALKDFDKDNIDFIIYCTQSPDYILPTTACILQDRLGLRLDIGAFDYNLGCSGYIYGLMIAKGFINANLANTILLVMAETYSKYIHPKDKGNLSIFGDGAAATIIQRSEKEHIFDFVVGTDGRGWNNLIVHSGASKNRTSESLVEPSAEIVNSFPPDFLYMNGPEIFNFTIKNVPGLVANTLRKNSLNLDDIDYVIFHQANKYMLEYLKKKIGIPENKFHIDIEHTGNTVSATIPIALVSCIEKNIVKNGDKILLVGFGVGYSWGATIIEL
jgi:3-oxoacyl-[acyl-carrier-protein] synthase-3